MSYTLVNNYSKNKVIIYASGDVISEEELQTLLRDVEEGLYTVSQPLTFSKEVHNSEPSQH